MRNVKNNCKETYFVMIRTSCNYNFLPLVVFFSLIYSCTFSNAINYEQKALDYFVSKILSKDIYVVTEEYEADTTGVEFREALESKPLSPFMMPIDMYKDGLFNGYEICLQNTSEFISKPNVSFDENDEVGIERIKESNSFWKYFRENSQKGNVEEYEILEHKNLKEVDGNESDCVKLEVRKFIESSYTDRKMVEIVASHTDYECSFYIVFDSTDKIQGWSNSF